MHDELTTHLLGTASYPDLFHPRRHAAVSPALLDHPHLGRSRAGRAYSLLRRRRGCKYIGREDGWMDDG